MEIRKIGVLSPGDMGQAIAARLKESGFDVYAALAGRSDRTRALAAEAGIKDCGSLEKLVATCDLIISVLNPGEAVSVSQSTAQVMKTAGRAIAYEDLNAV